MKTETKLAAASALLFGAFVWSFLVALSNASFAFSVGQEWRQQIATRWGNTAPVFLGLSICSGIAALWTAKRRPRSMRPSSLADHEDREFSVVYLPHWEVGRFVVEENGWSQRCLPHFPEGELERLNLDIGTRTRAGRVYQMRVLGRRGPEGAFGHRGTCVREFFVAKVIEVQAIEGKAADG